MQSSCRLAKETASNAAKESLAGRLERVERERAMPSLRVWLPSESLAMLERLVARWGGTISDAAAAILIAGIEAGAGGVS